MVDNGKPIRVMTTLMQDSLVFHDLNISWRTSNDELKRAAGLIDHRNSLV